MISLTTKNTNILSKSSKLYKMYSVVNFARLFFGFNFMPYYHKIPKVYRILVNLYCLTISIFVTFYAVYNGMLMYPPYIFIIIEYLLSVLYGIYNSKPLIFGSKFIQSVASIDKRLDIMDDCYDKIGLIHNIVGVCCIAFKVFYTSMYCYNFPQGCLEDPLLIVAANFIMIAVDINQLSRVVIVALMNYRMGILKKNIEKHFHMDFYLDTNDSKRIGELRKFLGIYRDIINFFELTSKYGNALYMVNLICCFPKIMVVFYFILYLRSQDTPLSHLLGMGLEGLEWAVVTCIPAVLAEMTTHNVDQIASMLLEKQVVCRDELTKEEIREFINYIEKRPFKYRLYRLVSIDMSLPIGLVSICTTYIIVLAQFTHIFE